MEEFRVCSGCHRRKPLAMFERGEADGGGYYKTCIRCRGRKIKKERVREGERELVSWEEFMGLVYEGLRVKPARRRPGDGPGWLEII